MFVDKALVSGSLWCFTQIDCIRQATCQLGTKAPFSLAWSKFTGQEINPHAKVRLLSYEHKHITQAPGLPSCPPVSPPSPFHIAHNT